MMQGDGVSQVRVEGRELPPYAEHCPAFHLREGEVYFRVDFHDETLLVPRLEPVVFIGRDLAIGDSGMLYLQDLDSYSEGARFGTAAPLEPIFTRSLEQQSSGVYEYERAVDELLRCSLRRQKGMSARGRIAMRFEARDLKPYAEPMVPRALSVDAIYFSVQFVDDEMLIPELEPLVFIGRNLGVDDQGLLYFQDAGSYRQGRRFESGDTDDAVFYAQTDDEIKHIFEYERALDVLLTCALKRRQSLGEPKRNPS